MFNTTLLWDTVTNTTIINEKQKLLFGFIWWQLLLFVLIGILFSITLCCVIYCTIVQTRKSSSNASEMPTNILINPTSKKSSSKNKSSSMKVQLISKRDIRSTVQDQHYPISNKKRSYWEHSLDYSNPYNPYSKRRSYYPESNYSA